MEKSSGDKKKKAAGSKSKTRGASKKPAIKEDKNGSPGNDEGAIEGFSSQPTDDNLIGDSV